MFLVLDTKLLLFIACIFTSLSLHAQISKKTLMDSIQKLRELSDDVELSDEERLYFAKRASDISVRIDIDSTILNSNRNLSYVYLTSGNYDEFGDININNLELARKLNDSAAIASVSNNLGWFNYQIQEDNNLAYKYYLIALKYYDGIGNFKQKAVVLTNIATIQDDEKDYLGSEQNAIEALRILNGLDDYPDLNLDKYICQNLLGIVSLKLKNYEKSIEYHNQAYSVTKRLDGGDYLGLESKNNIAIAYRDKGELDKALNIYEELLEQPEILKQDFSFYALVIDNNAFTKFLKGDYDYYEVQREFKRALKISDSIDNQFTKLATSIDLAKFYKANEVDELALFYAKQSYNISGAIPINDLYLESMLLLADLTEGEESKSYLESHIKLSDSLLTIERNVGNKFARIKFETDELEAENKQFARDKLFLTILSVALIITALLVYIVISQRAKNKELKLVQAQQHANEEIYNLMLVQQDKVEEARTQEKKRISEELHDGVLGRLFGARLSLDSLNFVEGKDAIKNRAGYIGQLKTIEDDIRQISHELNTDFVSGSGFMDIVTELIENQTQAYGLTYDFYFTDDISWENISNKTKINIYRIIQESMQNIYKHANAKHIKISITLKNNVILLDITDDGDGFDTAKSKKGIGLKNMTSRVDNLEGSIAFNSKIGEGTIVNVKIPYTPNAV